jgi:hypothetical protein
MYSWVEQIMNEQLHERFPEAVTFLQRHRGSILNEMRNIQITCNYPVEVDDTLQFFENVHPLDQLNKHINAQNSLKSAIIAHFQKLSSAT